MSELLDAAKRAAPGLEWKLLRDGEFVAAQLRSGPDKWVGISDLRDGFLASVGRTYHKGGLTLEEAVAYVRAKLTERRDALSAALGEY